jgi:hypothetical protein
LNNGRFREETRGRPRIKTQLNATRAIEPSSRRRPQRIEQEDLKRKVDSSIIMSAGGTSLNRHFRENLAINANTEQDVNHAKSAPRGFVGGQHSLSFQRVCLTFIEL